MLTIPSFPNCRLPDRGPRRPRWLRHLCAAGLALCAPWAAAFGFDDVAREAEALARKPYQPPPPLDARLQSLEYDEYRRIRFIPAKALWRGQRFDVQFFPLGRGARQPLRLHEVRDGQVRPLAVPADSFDSEGVLPPPRPGSTTPVAGWRLAYPLHTADVQDEVIAFLGASYFRALGEGQRYGLSARGVAIDTAGGQGEEFPSFTAFWFETPAPDARRFVFHALLDGPRITGAYRFEVVPGKQTTVEVRTRLFLRAPVTMLGIAPLTSMFLHGENQPSAGDFRPEVHDSDGLALVDGSGEALWRPLINPRSTFVTSFALRSPRGFGLMQRDRRFASYEDIEARYELRPSAWVEPIGDWGAGRVELLQFPTPDETHDNVAAYWVPAKTPQPGTPIDMAWRLHWRGVLSEALPENRPAGAQVVQTRAGHGYLKEARAPSRRQFVIDFEGASLPNAPDDAVRAVASGNAAVRIERVNAYPNPVTGGWRTTIEFERIDSKQPLELRVHLTRGAHVLGETWSYAEPPE